MDYLSSDDDLVRGSDTIAFPPLIETSLSPLGEVATPESFAQNAETSVKDDFPKSPSEKEGNEQDKTTLSISECNSTMNGSMTNMTAINTSVSNNNIPSVPSQTSIHYSSSDCMLLHPFSIFSLSCPFSIISSSTSQQVQRSSQ